MFVIDSQPPLPCLVLFGYLMKSTLSLLGLYPFPPLLLQSLSFCLVFLVSFFPYSLFSFLTPLFFSHRMLQPVPKQEGRTVVVVNSPRTLLGPVPVRPPPGPELSAQPTPCPTPPVLPAPLMVSTSPTGSPLIPASRPPGPVLLPPLQPNSGPLPPGELQGSQSVGLGGTSGRLVRLISSNKNRMRSWVRDGCGLCWAGREYVCVEAAGSWLRLWSGYI